MKPIRWVVAVALLTLVPALLAAQEETEPAERPIAREAGERAAAPVIDHEPLTCVVAGKAVAIDACIGAPTLPLARVYLHRLDKPYWYSVDMLRFSSGIAS